jgi:branched-chain amino acid transport system permease protein
MVIMAVLGGAGTVLGPVVGALVVMILNELLWSNFLELHNAFLGLVLIAVVTLMPNGLLDLVRRDRKTSVLATIRLNLQRYRV